MRRVAATGPGGPEVLQLESAAIPEPRPGEVLIRLHAVGVNRPDVLQRAGSYPPPPGSTSILGLEGAGEITAVGEGVDNWKVGDLVCALLPGGGYAEYCVTPAAHCLPIPDGFDMLTAAAVPETVLTVWANVIEAGALKQGESLLVHGGSSGIGTMAIQIARSQNTRVFATAGSDEKCMACAMLGAERAINYRREDFVEVVKSLTDGRGADVILDMVGGDYVMRNLRALAVEGRHVSIAFLQGSTVTLNLTHMMMRRQVLTGSTLRARSDKEKARLVSKVREAVWPRLAAGEIRPLVHSVFDLGEVAKAHELMETSRHIGKIMLKVHD
ncbi:NAD(P)H-quinone oxidoreductase [Mesorhizobium sp. RP14(2022)]|uniref:NAD(P)H-quinone oxidoreductase n=1 Tax=Mesorhizobium liriopis TaxID=2953882 RepID=A0ABT1C5U5_9HYPH|nr:NAD(P)H-quinone oxidoreductase [Mesorhizobium liriopis]MCO6049341.1 NAD(P)H-quinone oxidoreductase [Mesorhizobium liriopis]